MREYEFTVITKGDLPDNERADVLKKYEDLMFAEKGELLKREEWGSRKLAFPMKRKFRGYYTHYDFAVADNAEGLAEAERLMRIDDNVLRYLLIRSRDKVNPEQRRTELAKADTSNPQQ